MKEYAVAPIHASGVALRHVGPPGCNLSPALDLDRKPLGLGPRHLLAIARSLCPALRRVQLPLPGEAESGPAGVQPDEEYPGRRCANGTSGPGTETFSGAFFCHWTPELCLKKTHREPLLDARYLAWAGFSSQVVPRFNIAHITRTR